MKVVKDDREWKKIKKRLLATNKTKIKVGVFEGSRYGPENNNLPVATVLRWQEQGTTPSQNHPGIPPRPAMREGTVQKIRSRQAKVALNSLRSIIVDVGNPKRNSNASYHRAGKEITKLMKSAIKGWSSPPNAPSTIATKGFNDPLIDTHQMHDSIDYRIEK